MIDDSKYDKFITASDVGHEIHIEQIDKKLFLTYEHINDLDNLRRPDDISNFKFIGSHGIKFRNYYEMPILINHKYITFNIDEYWPIRKLTFKIADNQIEISPVSAAFHSVMAVFFEAKYSIELENFASIKIVINNGADYQNEFCKALYHLNRSLGEVDLYAEMFPEISGKYLSYSTSYNDLLVKVKRVKNISRSNFKKVQPLKLYNNAATLKGEMRFLSLYRILEFYMETGFEKHIDSIRYDPTQSNDDLAKEFRNNREIDQLRALLTDALTDSNKKSIINYCKTHSLIQSEGNFKEVVNSLYRYRNSIVHAKEKEIDRTLITSVFDKDEEQQHWIKILENICIKCINKHNVV